LPGGFLELFGKPVRESACECERSSGMMLGPVLALINGPIVSEALRDPNNRIARLVAANKDDAKLVEELYLAILCRPPTSKELQVSVETIRSAQADHGRMLVEAQKKKAALAEYEKQLAAKQDAWEAGLAQGPTWVPLDVVTVTGKGGAKF